MTVDTSRCAEIDRAWADSLDRGFKELARWASGTPRPRPPELVPGLPGVNRRLLLEYRERLVAWKVGRAEALQFGLGG